jgi:hypothetical protein
MNLDLDYYCCYTSVHVWTALVFRQKKQVRIRDIKCLGYGQIRFPNLCHSKNIFFHRNIDPNCSQIRFPNLCHSKNGNFFHENIFFSHILRNLLACVLFRISQTTVRAVMHVFRDGRITVFYQKPLLIGF